MKNSILLCAALLTLGACVSHNFSEGERTNYTCDGGKTFSLREVAGSVEVYAGGQTQRLMSSGEGSYSNGAVTLANSGGGRATLSGVNNSPYENCHASAQNSWLPSLW